MSELTQYEEQLNLLESKLPGAAIERRSDKGMDLSYLEAWYVIEVMNRIFGFDKWSREIISLTTTKAVPFKTKADKDSLKVGASCQYRLRVTFANGDEVTLEDVGHGKGMAPDEIDAIESAEKEAVSDALKRCARSLGNRLGNTLYDKKMRGVER